MGHTSAPISDFEVLDYFETRDDRMEVEHELYGADKARARSTRKTAEYTEKKLSDSMVDDTYKRRLTLLERRRNTLVSRDAPDSEIKDVDNKIDTCYTDWEKAMQAKTK